jgi:hypothetical protein
MLFAKYFYKRGSMAGVILQGYYVICWKRHKG